MKNTILKIFAFSIIVISFSAYSQAEEAFPASRVAASGSDPNDIKSGPEATEANIMIPGFQPGVPYCKDCQNRNNLLLSDQKDHAQPGLQKTTAPSTDGVSSGKQNK